MRVSALEVATAILENVNGTAEQDAANLAICISRNNGAIRIGQTRAVWLVLGSVLNSAETPHPTIVATSMRTLIKSGALLSTEAVAQTFRDAVRRDVGNVEDGCYPQGYRPTWAPALIETPPGQVSLGGATTEPKDTTVGLKVADNEYAWYDLAPHAAFSVGRVVFRIKYNGVLVAYQRVQTNRWLCVTAMRPACPIPLESILNRLDVSEIEPVDARLPVIYTRLAPPGM